MLSSCHSEGTKRQSDKMGRPQAGSPHFVAPLAMTDCYLPLFYAVSEFRGGKSDGFFER